MEMECKSILTTHSLKYEKFNINDLFIDQSKYILTLVKELEKVKAYCKDLEDNIEQFQIVTKNQIIKILGFNEIYSSDQFKYIFEKNINGKI